MKTATKSIFSWKFATQHDFYGGAQIVPNNANRAELRSFKKALGNCSVSYFVLEKMLSL